MTIDAIPHDFSYEAADCLEAIHAIELCHSKGRIIAVAPDAVLVAEPARDGVRLLRFAVPGQAAH